MVLPISLPLAGGVDVMRTPLQVGKGLVNSNLIRHRNGLIQKLAGCTRLSSLTFQGICRCLFPWQDLQGNHYLAVGTNQLIQIFAANAFTTIQPVSHTSNLSTPTFATMIGNASVVVTDGAYSPAVGSWVQINTLTYIGGVLLQGTYATSSPVGSTYVVTAPTAATSTSTGSAVLNFATTNGSHTVVITLGTYVFTNGQTISVGVSTAVGGLTFLGPYTVTVTGGVASITTSNAATGTTSGFENSNQTQIIYFTPLPSERGVSGAYGLGPYGGGAYGVGLGNTGQTGNEGSEPGVIFLNEWSMDRWGQNLVFCYVGSTVYQWVPPIAPGNVAAAVSGAPQAVNGLFVAAPQQQTMAWGLYSSALSEQDQLLVGWCDVADLTDWTASATNQAGTFRLSTGSLIVSGTWFGVAGLFWTDIDLWAMTYVGFPLVYGFNKVSPNCGLIARRAWATIGTLAVWMSQNDFFIYQGGSVGPLTCSVRDFVFNTLDKSYLESIHADTNTYGGEVTWWFPQIGSNGVCTAAVKWHAAGGEWDIIQSGLSVSAWYDQSVLGPPIGSFYNGLLEQFETSIDFDGMILDSYFVSGFFQIAEGEEFVYIDRVYPDFTLSAGGQVQMTFLFADDMAAAMNPNLVRSYGPYTVTSATEYIIVRGRGRVMQLRVDCNQILNSFWRYGEPLMTCSIDGRR